MKHTYNKLAVKYMIITLIFLVVINLIVLSILLIPSQSNSGLRSISDKLKLLGEHLAFIVILGIVWIPLLISWIGFSILWFVNLFKWWSTIASNSKEDTRLEKTMLLVAIITCFLFQPIAYILVFLTISKLMQNFKQKKKVNMQKLLQMSQDLNIDDFYIEKSNYWLDKLVRRKDQYRPKVKNLDDRFDREKQGDSVILKIRHLDVSYGRRNKKFKAIMDVSLNIYKGEILGLVGESGSGKSTMCSVIAGLVPRSFGSLQIKGISIPKRLGEIKGDINNFLVNNIQMIFQDPAGSLNPYKNIYKVVSEGLNNIKKDLKKFFIKTNNFDVIQEFKSMIDKFKDSKFNLSYLLKTNDEKPKKVSEFLFGKFTQNLKNSKHEIAMNQFYNKHKMLLKGKFEQEKRDLIIKLLKSVGLDESILSRHPLEFSGGQQQRIGISRAIVVRPTLLVADEPISALDVSIQAQVINIFKDLREEYDLTILLIAHDLRMVEYVSDRIAVMYKGRIVEIGKSKDIAHNSLHPYTKSLLEAIPSLESKKESLIGYRYDPIMHQYTKEIQPEWIKLNDEHYILATLQEVTNWKENIY